MSEQIRSFEELRVYQEAFVLRQEIFSATKRWPVEERYSLTDQIRRSARSVGANLAEAWAKRRYPANFVSKLSDADGELQETAHWLETAEACGCLCTPEARDLRSHLNSIGRKPGSMMSKPEAFTPRAVAGRPLTSDLRPPSRGLGRPPE